jgi:signal transduction histidine kinase
MASLRKPSSGVLALLIGAGYLFAGVVWITFSDRLGVLLFSDPEHLHDFQTSKGLAFVAVSALLLFLAVWRAGLAPAFERAGAVAPDREPLAAAGAASAPVVVWLSLLVAITAAPLLAVLAFNLLQLTHAARADAHRLVTNVSERIGSEMQLYFRARQQTVDLLVRLRPPATDCGAFVAAVSEVHDEVRQVTLHDRAGRPVCATGSTPPQPLQPRWVRQREAVILPAEPKSPADDLTFSVVYPLRDPEGAVQVTSGVRRLHLFLPPLPPGAVAGVVDTGNVLLARSHRRELLGRRLPPGQELERDAGGTNVQFTIGPDGIERIYGIHRVPGLGVSAFAGLAPDEVYRPMHDAASKAAAMVIVFLLVALALVAAVARRITGPIRALARTAKAVADGQVDGRAPAGGPAEIAAVSAQFNQMLERLPAMEAELRASEVRHRELLEKLSRHLPGVIYDARIHGERFWIPFISNGSNILFELSPDEVREDARRMFDRVHPDDRAQVLARLQEAQERPAPLVLDYRVVLPRRGERHLLTRAFTERLPDGSLAMYGCTLDVTLLYRARMALAAMNADLERRVQDRTVDIARANEALESFSYSVAHDLRAPLDAIVGFSGALQQAIAQGDPARVRELAGRIEANGETMVAMLQGLLALARASRVAPEHETRVDVGAMVQEVLRDLQVPAGWQVDVAPLPAVCADPATFRQVWANLLGNALKFAAGAPQPSIRVAAEVGAEGVVFRVTDNGVGFAAADAERIFRAFQRGHDAAAFEGHGIGLSVVQRVVEHHGGRVWAESHPGAGASFFVQLPPARLVRP